MINFCFINYTINKKMYLKFINKFNIKNYIREKDLALS